MRAIFIIPVALLLAACSSTGTFVNPSAMTPADRCFSAQLVLAGMEANMPEGDTLERARVNTRFICSLVPVEGPLPRPAE